MRQGGDHRVARVAEQDVDRVDADAPLPLSAHLGRRLLQPRRPRVHLTLIRAYNDWLSEYAAAAPDRLMGIAQIPTIGLEPALAELERAATLPGMGGAGLACFPNGSTNLLPEDDRFWARCEALGWTVNIHVGFVNQVPRTNNAKLPGDVRFHDS